MQFEALAGFSAIIDRLGEFSEVVDNFASPPEADALPGAASSNGAEASKIDLVDRPNHASSATLLSLESVTLRTPNGMRTLVQDLTLQVRPPGINFMINHNHSPCSSIPVTRPLPFHLLGRNQYTALAGLCAGRGRRVAAHCGTKWDREDISTARNCRPLVQRLWHNHQVLRLITCPRQNFCTSAAQQRVTCTGQQRVIKR